MRLRVLGALASLLCGVLLALAALCAPIGPMLTGVGRSLALSVSIVLLAIGVAALGTAVGGRRRARAFMRLDHFLPFLRKPRSNDPPQPPALLIRLARRVLPKSLLADPATGKPGWIRKTLKAIGPTVLSSPVRRLVQTGSFLLFLWLFFYVCWPYGARPDPPGEVSSGWRFAEIEQDTGRLRFDGLMSPNWQFNVGQLLHVVRETGAGADDETVGAFHVTRILASGVLLTPDKGFPLERLDKFFLSAGPWSFHEKAPDRWPSHYAEELAAREIVPADLYLAIDPLVSVSTAIAARSWIWSLTWAGVILIVCVLIPRGFCGYLCPLGALIDLSDWGFAKRVARFRVSNDGWWVHIKYYLLFGSLLCSAFGVLVTGYVAAIPVVTRGMLFLGERVQNGLLRGWHQTPPMSTGHYLSIILFFSVLGLSLLKPRFWCKYVCPSGAIFSLGNLFRVSERKVESSCGGCKQCVEICPFDAIKPDFNTRVTDCTFCQTCGGACPSRSIKFVERWNTVELKAKNDPSTGESAIGRRGFLSLAAGATAATIGGAGLCAVTKTFGADLGKHEASRPLRPPGSVPEREFLTMCIRCGQCFKVCPNNVLQLLCFEQGLEGLWTPYVNADWAGCEPSCNACGQVCPTGAIRPLPLEEKKAARMGLAVVNPQTCLPLVGRAACQRCVDECHAAGYSAIEFTQVGVEVDDAGKPIEGTGFLAPVVLSERCVGCGLCQTGCYVEHVKEKRLERSAIIIEAGEGKEDRLVTGSYVRLREEEAKRRRAAERSRLDSSSSDYYVPDVIDDSPDPFGMLEEDEKPSGPKRPAAKSSDPFGLESSDPFGLQEP